MITGHEITFIVLLITSVITFWFTVIMAMRTEKSWPFAYSFINCFLLCFAAAGLFTGFDITPFYFYFVYLGSFVTGVLYMIAIGRVNNDN